MPLKHGAPPDAFLSVEIILIAFSSTVRPRRTSLFIARRGSRPRPLPASRRSGKANWSIGNGAISRPSVMSASGPTASASHHGSTMTGNASVFGYMNAMRLASRRRWPTDVVDWFAICLTSRALGRYAKIACQSPRGPKSAASASQKSPWRCPSDKARALSVAMVKNDDTGKTRLVKKGSNNTSRDDVAAALVRASGVFQRTRAQPKRSAAYLCIA